MSRWGLSITPLQVIVIATCILVASIAAWALLALGSHPELFLVNITAFSLSYLVTGAIAWIRRPASPVGPVMLAVSVAAGLSFFTLYPDPLIRRSAGFSGSVATLLIVWLVLSAPAGRLGRGMGAWVLAGFAIVLGASALVTELPVLRALFAAGAAISLVLAAVVARRWTSASMAARRALGPVVLAGMVVALVHAVDFGSGVLLIPVTPGSPVYWADTLSRMLVPFGFLVGLLRLRMARGAVADLIVGLGETGSAGRLQAVLASTLNDPSLVLGFWSDDRQGFVDASGALLADSDDTEQAVTYLTHEGKRQAAIFHDPALAEDPALVAAVVASVRMAVDNERLAAEVQAQLEEVRASRSRIVTAGDAERRRLERDLHDGAQQRLVALSLALRRAQSRAPDGADDALAASLGDASQLVREALDELRELARGLHPAILTEAGLPGAVTALSVRSSVPVAVLSVTDERLPSEVEAGAYFFVSEALANVAKHAPESRASVRVDRLGDAVEIEVVDDGPGGASARPGSGLQGLEDRVAAVGGTFEMSSPPGDGTRLRARIPLQAKSTA
jgi:signal transduction histidine kinase